MMAWMPQLPSTTWVTPKSTATEISEIASSLLKPLVFIKKPRILRNASRRARSIDRQLAHRQRRDGEQIVIVEAPPGRRVAAERLAGVSGVGAGPRLHVDDTDFENVARFGAA